jgi:hypothetical protein
MERGHSGRAGREAVSRPESLVVRLVGPPRRDDALVKLRRAMDSIESPQPIVKSSHARRKGMPTFPVRLRSNSNTFWENKLILRCVNPFLEQCSMRADNTFHGRVTGQVAGFVGVGLQVEQHLRR